jgi:xylose isomerase
MRHFDAHPYRTEDDNGIWDFVKGCMRTYEMLADKAERFRHDADIQEALVVAGLAEQRVPTSPLGATPEGVNDIIQSSFDIEALTARGYGHERLDQLVTELLLGVR